MSPMSTIIPIIALLCVSSQAKITYVRETWFPFTPTAMALAETVYNNGSGTFNVVMGLDDGTVSITNINNNNFNTTFKNATGDEPVMFLDWNSAGVCAASQSKARIIDSTGGYSRMYLEFPG